MSGRHLVHQVHDTLTDLLVPVDSLEHYPGNARTHDEEVLRESLELNGQYRPIVVQKSTRRVLAGNGTLGAVRQLGWSHVAVTFVDVGEDEARRIVLVDNRANDLAGYDLDALADLLKSAQPDLSGTGFDQAYFDQLIASLYQPASLTDPDDAPPKPAEPRSQLGDVWLLGGHRLVCGDSTDLSVVERVMDGVRADCMWTDPPYGVDYGVFASPEAARKARRRTDGLTVTNDGAQNLPGILSGAFGLATSVLALGAAVYVAHPAGALSLTFGQAFIDVGWRWHETLVWVKDVFAMGRSDYHYQHEPIMYGYTQGAKGRRGRGGEGWFGDNRQTSVIQVARPKASEMHPTMKPTGLIVRHLNNSCRPGGVVYDPFGGSGSTLIAAHLTGRTARLVEIDPGYCDVICRRYQEHIGTVPILEATGEPHDFTQDKP